MPLSTVKRVVDIREAEGMLLFSITQSFNQSRSIQKRVRLIFIHICRLSQCVRADVPK